MEAVLSIDLMLIANKPSEVDLWDKAGVDFIFIDLEIFGKESRQGHLNTVISKHEVDDVTEVKPYVTKGRLLVRINPLNSGTFQEVDDVISRGAEVIMLPMFRSASDVELLIDYVNGRCEVYPLIETPEALNDIDRLATIQGVSGYHIGLNDLHLAYGMSFMFEVMLTERFKYATEVLRAQHKIIGIGGVAKLGDGYLPAEMILKEYARHGASRTILSRSFKLEATDKEYEIGRIKSYFDGLEWSDLDEELFRIKVLEISERIANG